MQSTRTARATGREALAISAHRFPYCTIPPLAERSGCRPARSPLQFKLASVRTLEPLQWDNLECENLSWALATNQAGNRPAQR